MAVSVFLAAPRLLGHDGRPELVSAAAFVATQLRMAVAIALARDGREYLLPMLV